MGFNPACYSEIASMKITLKQTSIFLSLLLTILLTSCSGSEQREEKYLQRAKELFAEKNYEKARVETKNVLQINPKNAEARFLLAKMFREEGDFRQAYGNFNAVVEENPEFYEARVELAKILFAAQENELTEEQLEAVLAAEPNNKGARILKAGLYSRRGEIEKAIEIGEAVLADDAGSTGAIAVLAPIYLSTNPDKSLALIDQGLEKEDNNIILKQLKIEILSALGKAKEVERLLIEITTDNPEITTFYYRLARGYAFQNRLEESELTLRKAVENNPENIEPKIKLMEFTIQRKGAEEAEQLIKNFIGDKADTYDLHQLLAKFYIASNRVEDAKKVYSDIMANNLDSIDSLRARNALIEIHLLENNRPLAEKLLNEIFDIEPTNTNALISRARLLLADGDTKSAIADLRAALKNDSESITALKLLALSQEREDLHRLALDNYRRVLSLESDDIHSLVAAGRLSLKDGRQDQAKVFLERALRLDPVNLQAASFLIGILANEQLWNQAHKLLEPMLSSDQHRASALLLNARLHRLNNQWAEAKKDYEEALKLSPRAFEAIAGFVDTFLTDNDYTGAKEFLSTHLEKYPDLTTAQDILATVYLKNDESNKALDIYENLLKETPNQEVLYQKIAQIHIQNKEYDKAKKVYQRGIKHNSNFNNLKIFLANQYALFGETELSKQLYEEVLKINPNLDLVKNNLAMLLVNKFPTESNFARALDLASGITDQKNPNYISTLGWVHYHLGNLPQSISYLEAANRQNKMPEYHYHLGMAYYKNQQIEKAKDQLTLATQDKTANYHGIKEARATLVLLSK